MDPGSQGGPIRAWLARVHASVWGSAALALALRVARLLEARATDPFYRAHLLDSAFYDEFARRLLGEGAPVSGPYLMAPLYGYFLAAIYWVEGLFGLHAEPGPVYLLQILLGAATAGMAAALGARLGAAADPPRGRGWGGWIAGLLFATYPVAIIFDARLLSVTLSTALGTLGLLALERAADEDHPGPARLAGLAGLAFGLATTARGNLLLVLPALLLIYGLLTIPRRGLLPAALLALGMALPIGLCTAHNAAAGAGFAPVSVNGGINLYRGNNPWFVDEAVHPFHMPGERDALEKRATLVASIELGRWAGPGEVDQYWRGEAARHWREDPLRYAALLMRKVGQVLGAFEIGDNVDLDAILHQSTSLGWLPRLYGLMSALGLAGLWVDRVRGRRSWALRALVVVSVLSVALFFVVSRYRLPLVPLWAGLSGGAVAWMVAAARARAWRPLAGAGGLVVGLWALLAQKPTSLWLPWSWLIDDRSPAERAAPDDLQTRCAVDRHALGVPAVDEKYFLAVYAIQNGHDLAAEQRLREVLAVDPDYASAAVNLCTLLLSRPGKPEIWDEVVKLSAHVLEKDPCNEKALASLGMALAAQGKPEAALGALSRAASIDPYEPNWRAAMGQVWLSVGQPDKAREALEFAVKWDPEGWKARALLARIDLRERRMAEAATLLQEAVEILPDRAELWALLGLAELGQGDLDKAEAALKRGEAAWRKTGGEVDPVLEALRKAFDKAPPLPQKRMRGVLEPLEPAPSGAAP